MGGGGVAEQAKICSRVTCRRASGALEEAAEVQLFEDLRGLGMLRMSVTGPWVVPLSALCFDTPAAGKALPHLHPAQLSDC